MSDVIVVGLCGFFITYVLRYTLGPFDMFFKFRHMVGIDRLPVLDSYGNITDYRESIETPDKFTTKLVSCFWCFTTWITFLVAVAYFLLFGMKYATFPFLWLASAGLSGFLYAMIDR